MDVNGTMDESGDERQAVILESDGETYLITPGPNPSEGYVLSVFLPTLPTDGKGSGVVEEFLDDKDTPATAPTPKVGSRTEESLTSAPTPAMEIDAPKDDRPTPVPDPQVEPQHSSPPPQPSSIPPPPEKTVPQISHTKILRSNLRDEDFKFEQDVIVVCARGEESGVSVKVVRWRWYL